MNPVVAVTVTGLFGNLGTIVAIAAAIAVAVIAILVFSQGQELKRLRNEAEQQGDRAYAAESALAASQSVASSVVRTGPVSKAAVAAATAAPATTKLTLKALLPVGMAAPAIGSATPSPALSLVQVKAAVAANPDPAPLAAPVVVPAPAPASSAVPVATHAAERSIAAPSTAAAARAPRPPAPPQKRRRNLFPAALATIIVIGAGAFLVSQLDGGSTATKTKPPTSTTGSSGVGAIVAVLNGTPVSGLAGQVADTLATAGFKKGVVTNAPDQLRAATLVSYLPGHKSDAEAVAAKLGIKARVEPVDDNALSIACPPPAACTAEVVVTVGSDRTR